MTTATALVALSATAATTIAVATTATTVATTALIPALSTAWATSRVSLWAVSGDVSLLSAY